jgi:hypothetical protein
MRALFSIAALLTSTVLQAQSTFSMNAGIGRFKMGDLKAYQQDMANSFPVDAQVISAFPDYRVYEVGLQWLRPRNLVIGAAFANGSTGGRVSYSDYSGSAGGDQLLSYKSYGATFGAQKSFLRGMVIVQADVRPSLNTSVLTLTRYFHTATTNTSTETIYKSQNVTLQPTASVFLRYKFVALNGQVGYTTTINTGEFKYTEGDNISTQGLTADWSGFRVSAGVSFMVGPAEPKPAATEDIFVVGLGIGLDYGGIGVNLLTYPTRNVGLFAGFGYALAGFGYNGGLKLRILNKPTAPAYAYILAMYGYNASVKVKGNSSYNRLFYGPSAGIGVETTANEQRRGQWSVALLLPFRGEDPENYINSLKSVGVDFGNRKLFPVTISLGYRFTKTFE